MSYQLPSSFLQKFTPKEIHDLKAAFKKHDHDYAAEIAVADLHTALREMGEPVTQAQVDNVVLKQVALARPTHVTYQEFLNLVYDLRTGGIALDAAALMQGLSINAPSAVAPAPAPLPSTGSGRIQQVSFFPTKTQDDAEPVEDDVQMTAFAAKPQWPPMGSSQSTGPASPVKASWPPAPGLASPAKASWPQTTGPASPAKASWPPAPAAGPASPPKQSWPPAKTTPPKPTNASAAWPSATTSASPAKLQQWSSTASASSPSKPQWPPTATASASSPAKPQWPPTTGAAASSPTKPQWPPSASTPAPAVPSPSKTTQWPQEAALKQETSPAKWTVAQTESAVAATKPQWPPTASASTPAPDPAPVKSQWPPAQANAPPAPAPVAQETKRQSWPPAGSAAVPAPPAVAPQANAVPESKAIDAQTMEVLQRRASAVARYNANVTIHEVKGAETSLHSYSEEETAAFTEHINNCLQQDKDLSGVVPINAQGGLFQAVQDGVLLCKLVNAAVPETVDERAINRKRAKTLNVYEMTENQNLCINAAKSIGCSVVNIGPTDLIEGRPILVLGLVWQLIKIQLTSAINLKSHPELMRLLMEGESLEAFMKLPPDQILLRWMNYHLKAAGHPKVVTNFSSDVQDAVAYSVLLHHIAPAQCDLCMEAQPEARAAHVIQNARRLDVETFLKPRDITSGNPKLNMSFVAQLFNTCPALNMVEEDLKQLEEVLYDDVGDTREERVFRMWINSLGIDELYIMHLFADLRDGINLLKVFDRIAKGIVAWPKVNLVAPNKFQQVENCNYCVVLGKQLQFSLVNIGGADLFEGNKKLMLSLIWQSMRYHQLALLSELARSRGRGGVSQGHRPAITDADILQWANAKVLQGGKTTQQVAGFRDLALSSSVYLLSLIHAVEPRAVNWDMVTPGYSLEDKASNAKYAISCAQKIGALVFLTYEDIVEVKPKMMMTFVASLMSVDMHRQQVV